MYDLKGRNNYSNTQHYVKLLEKLQFQREVKDLISSVQMAARDDKWKQNRIP